MAKREFVDEIVRTERMNSSANANPRFRVHFKSGVSYPTKPDASVAYGIENPEYNSGPVRVTLERDQIVYVTPATFDDVLDVLDALDGEQ